MSVMNRYNYESPTIDIFDLTLENCILNNSLSNWDLDPEENW